MSNVIFHRGDKVSDKEGEVYFFACYLQEKACVGQFVNANDGKTEIRFYSVDPAEITPVKIKFKLDVVEDYRYREFYFEEEVLEYTENFFNQFVAKNRAHILYIYLKTLDVFVYEPIIHKAKFLKLCKLEQMNINAQAGEHYRGYGMILEFEYSFKQRDERIKSIFLWPLWINGVEINDFSEKIGSFIFPIKEPFVFVDGMRLEKESGFEDAKDGVILQNQLISKS